MRRIDQFGYLALSFFTCASCGPPRAETIDANISSVIEHGIADGSERFDHQIWDGLVQEYVRDDGRRFDYAGLKNEEAKFETYLEALSKADLKSLSADELQTLFINAYNAYTIKTILDHVSRDGTYEIESIRDIPDVFQREVHKVGGFELSLDNMEHNILRPIFKDPRVHFAVNCASTSCPPLPLRAFRGESLDAQLDEVTRKTLTNPDYISVENDTLLVTKIMDWYGGDFVNEEFEGTEETLPAYIAKYASKDVRDWIVGQNGNVKVEFRDYDWNLNKSR